MEWYSDWIEHYISTNGLFRVCRHPDRPDVWMLRDRRSGETWNFSTLALAKENAERVAVKQPPTDEYGGELRRSS